MGTEIFVTDPQDVINNSIFLNPKKDLIGGDQEYNFDVINCWFGNIDNNYNITPSVDDVTLKNWLFLNSTKYYQYKWR